MKEAISKFKIGDLVTLDNKMKEMLGVFINMIKKIKELENADGRNIIENR